MSSENKLPGIGLFDLADRIAVVTGGSKGLGYAMAAGLASAGCKTVLVSRTAAEVEQAASQIESDFGVASIGIAADVTDPQRIDEMLQDVHRRFGRLDILINNAGVNIRGPIEQLTLDDFREVQRVNVDALWTACRSAVTLMKKYGRGRIINMSSTLGLVGLADRTPYASSKGAVVQLTRALAVELAPDNITVNAICPGPFLTPMNQPVVDSKEATKQIIGSVALGRWGRMEEIQGAAIYLASDASSYTTGSVMVVDGGWTAQ